MVDEKRLKRLVKVARTTTPEQMAEGLRAVASSLGEEEIEEWKPKET